jgi:hypothetical protein
VSLARKEETVDHYDSDTFAVIPNERKIKSTAYF